jgi:hypothetical protein
MIALFGLIGAVSMHILPYDTLNLHLDDKNGEKEDPNKSYLLKTFNNNY